MTQKELGIADLPGVGPSTAEKLEAAGIDTLLAVAVISIGVLTEEAGVSESVARKMIQAAREMLDMGFEPQMRQVRLPLIYSQLVR